MKNKRKLLSFILVLSMIAGLFSNSYVYAYSDTESRDESHEESANEVPAANLYTKVHHLAEDASGKLQADALQVSENDDTVAAEMEGFSHYTVEFTFDEKQYVMQGDSTVALTDILSFVGITKADGSAAEDSDITAVSVSDESLFSASNDSREWEITAHKAFHTDEWMKVTVDGVEYEIVVTDATYSSGTVNCNNLEVDDIIEQGVILSYNYYYIYLDSEDNCVAGTSQHEDKTWTVTKRCHVTRAYPPGTGPSGGSYSGGVYLSSTFPPEYNAPTAKTGLLYSGVAQELINKGSVSKRGTMEYAIGTDANTAPADGWSTSVPTGTNVGTYYIWWRINKAEGYTAVGASCIESTISIGNQTLNVSVDGKVYDGKAATENITGTKAGELTRVYSGTEISGSPYNSSTTPKNAGTTENSGNVIGMAFVYSGNFIAEVERTQHDELRAVFGISPYEFNWKLASGESFNAPEVVLVESHEGLGSMSRTFHDLIRNHLIRSPYLHEQRPILIINWEATYFNFNMDKLLEIAKQAKECGIEMLVMDDGWFGKRDSDNSSLGDWTDDPRKLPEGVKGLCEKAMIKEQVADYKKYNHIVREGDYYRITSASGLVPKYDSECSYSWMCVAKDKSEALYTYVQERGNANKRPELVKLAGLDPDFQYVLDDGRCFFGDELMNVGFVVDKIYGDGAAKIYHFKKK